MNLDINFKTNIYFVVLFLDRKQWLHPLLDGLRMLYDVWIEDTIDIALVFVYHIFPFHYLVLSSEYIVHYDKWSEDGGFTK